MLSEISVGTYPTPSLLYLEAAEDRQPFIAEAYARKIAPKDFRSLKPGQTGVPVRLIYLICE